MLCHAESGIFRVLSSQVLGQYESKFATVKIPTFARDSGYTNLFEDREFSSIILDLRNNGGGETEKTVEFVDEIIGDASMKLCYYNGNVEILQTHTDDKDINVPIIILVNGMSASSSEVVASFLKQYADATLIGTNTYGKGVFQKNEAVSNGTLHYTAGYFTVGDWECWQDKGIAPDIEVQMDYDENIIGTDKDIQLQKALEILG